MIRAKTELVLIVTIFAIVFTTLAYLSPLHYAQLWLALEIITIPALYLIGYEFMLHQQSQQFEETTSRIAEKVIALEKENQTLRMKLIKNSP